MVGLLGSTGRWLVRASGKPNDKPTLDAVPHRRDL
jgi:hypothetical protein